MIDEADRDGDGEVRSAMVNGWGSVVVPVFFAVILEMGCVAVF